MYVITFYSFKGGVGRTMALANVGMELARTGRRVLLVDFDLEAPGLDTFHILKSRTPTPGIVDYITQYRDTGVAPNASDFVYSPEIPCEIPGTVWVMPTGKQDEHYGRRLNSIDWQELYSERDGYILFEDLKEQWRQRFNPDYVLVDSRTGHTDIGGICTRQLPDAVVVLFFPNEQNRRGIEVVVRDIRREGRVSKRPIQLYFVAANVPDLDDEENILSERLLQFRATLDYKRLDGTIHHYDSFSILQQTVFTIERPRTKLAREYRDLSARIIIDNLADRRRVLEVLGQLPRDEELFRGATLEEVGDRLNRIKDHYAEDGEVLHALGQANEFLGRQALAKSLFTEARRRGYETADALVERAISCYKEGSTATGRRLIEEALRGSRERVFNLDQVFMVVLQYDIEFVRELVATLVRSGVRQIDRLLISNRLMAEREALGAVEDLLRPLLQSAETAHVGEFARHNLALCLIAQGRFPEAMEIISPARSRLSEMGIRENFNYAVAEWGATGRLPIDLFDRILEFHSRSPRDEGANYYQCIAIALWAVGRVDEARECIERSRTALEGSENTFSVWRYLYVDREVLRHDTDALERMIVNREGSLMVLRS